MLLSGLSVPGMRLSWLNRPSQMVSGSTEGTSAPPASERAASSAPAGSAASTLVCGLSAAVADKLRSDALAAHRALGCRDMSRVDFLLDADGVGWMLELNTIPGFTSHSLLPKAAAEAGIGFDELCERLARMAMAR